jgi:hypothetical protein
MILLLKAYHVEELLKKFYRKLSESVVSFKALFVRIMMTMHATGLVLHERKN